MPTKVKVAAIQAELSFPPPELDFLNPAYRADKAAILSGYVQPRLDKVCTLLEQAGQEGCDIVATSEDVTGISRFLPDIGPDSLFFRLSAEAGLLADAAMAQVARKHRMYVVGCYLHEQGGAIYNRATIFGRDGAAVGSYDKVQLPSDEAWQIAPGDSLPVFDLDFGRVGLAICYDMMFPEILSVLGLRGARIVFHPTAGYGWYDSIGEATLRTRANDNDLYIVTAKSYVYAAAGHSSVIDHWGQVKADAGFDADVVVSHCIDLDQEKVQPPWFVPTRMTGEPSLRRRRALERRPALYAPLADERLAGRLVQPEEEKPAIVEDLRSGRVHW